MLQKEANKGCTLDLRVKVLLRTVEDACPYDIIMIFVRKAEVYF